MMIEMILEDKEDMTMITMDLEETIGEINMVLEGEINSISEKENSLVLIEELTIEGIGSISKEEEIGQMAELSK